MPRGLPWLLPLLLLTGGPCLSPVPAAATAEAEPPAASFRRDVMQVLSKAGCNAGACHGNANGKGGFKLSLRGEDPATDHRALTAELGGRRINTFEPAQSLILLKATTGLAHEGGRRFQTNDWEYRSLQRWIAAGAEDDAGRTPPLVALEVTPGHRVVVEPEARLQLQATAVFADGSRRDVTREAVYEPAAPTVRASAGGTLEPVVQGESVVLARYLSRQVPVRVAFIPARPGYRWTGPRPVNFVDRHLFARWRELRMNPAADCGDRVFLRRVHLDLLGALPTGAEARAFAGDRRPDKRARLVDDLLERPEFADFWALKWGDLLRLEERALDRKGLDSFHRWIRDSLATGKPMDQFARELVAARGSTYAHPPANFYRANRTPVDRALTVAQVFLGTRLHCAQCHNHPFDRWSQEDYHDWAAVFARIQFKVLRNDRRDENDSHEFKGEQVVYLAARGEVENPRTGRPARPRWLGETHSPAAPAPGKGDELDALAAWITRHPDFARVLVNRAWFHLMGRGLVDPVDDFRATNPPSHPALLEELAGDFVRHHHDLRHLLRRILLSATYQRASEPHPGNPDDDTLYTHALVRRLGAEVLLDIQHQAAGVVPHLRGYPEGVRAIQQPGAAPTREARKNGVDRFLETFGKPPRLLTCECERSADTTMAQAFQLISGGPLQDLIRHPRNRLATLLASGGSDREILDDLFWSVLSRPPAEEERAALLRHLGQGDRRAALEDLLWSLLNAKEFILRN